MLSSLAPISAAFCFLLYAIWPMPPRMDDLALSTAAFVDQPVAPESRDRPELPGRYLRLTFSSRRNLTDVAENSGLNTYALIVDCADRDSGFYAYGPFQEGLHTSSVQLDSDNPRREGIRRRRAERHSYELFLPERGRLRSQADFNRPMPDYDLARQTRTLCIRLGGGNMAGGFFRSNEVQLAVPL